MATPVIMPRQGNTVESCIISKFYKQKGDTVKEGDILFTYETDKATFDEEAKVSGTLLEIFFEEGDDVPVLTNVLVIGEPGEDVSEFAPSAGETGSGEEVQKVVEKEEKAEEVQAAAQPVQQTADGEIKISPRARNLAKKTGIDYRFATASGPKGRIIERDILELQEKGPKFTAPAMEAYMQSPVKGIVGGTGIGGRITTADLMNINVPQDEALAEAASQPLYWEKKLTNIRKVIAKAMHNSLANSAQLTLNSSFDATEILEYRKKLKASAEKLGVGNITINDLIIYAVSRTLKNHEDLNAHFIDDKMLIFNNVHIGVAVDTERGLMVPTLFNANLKSLSQISAETKVLIDSCKKGTINPDLLKGASFTITNLGTLGIESFTPVLNPPQTGILGVNTVVQRAKEVNGELIYYPAMGLSLTFDHRAVDGAPAARFLMELKNNLENFSVLLAK